MCIRRRIVTGLPQTGGCHGSRVVGRQGATRFVGALIFFILLLIWNSITGGTIVNGFGRARSADIDAVQLLAGPAGPKGDGGPAGSKGDTGAVGPAGPVGEAGPVGPAGSAGPVGPAGPKGHSGPIGPKGNTGPTGPAGPKGDAGPREMLDLSDLPGPRAIRAPLGREATLGPLVLKVTPDQPAPLVQWARSCLPHHRNNLDTIGAVAVALAS